MPSFWVRSSIFFTTALAFVVALAWKDAVHVIFKSAFPLVSRMDPTTILRRKSMAMVAYAMVATALALVVVSLLPYHAQSTLTARSTTEQSAETQPPLPGEVCSR